MSITSDCFSVFFSMLKLAVARRGFSTSRTKVKLPKRKALRSNHYQKENGRSSGKGDRTRKKNMENRSEPVFNRREKIIAPTVYIDDLSSNHSDNDDESSYQTATEEEEDCSSAKKGGKMWIRKNADDDGDDEYVPTNSELSDVDDEENDESSLDDDDDYLMRTATSSTWKRQKETKNVADKTSTSSEGISCNEHSMDDEDVSSSSDDCVSGKDRKSDRATRKLNSNPSFPPSDDEDTSHSLSSNETDDDADEDDSPNLTKVNKKTTENSPCDPGGDNCFSNIFSIDETDEDTNEDGSHKVTHSNSSCNSVGDEDFSNIFSMDETDEDSDEDVSPSKRDCCQNKVDAITISPLDPIHVCWISPDGENRQCYNIDTLRKVSISREKDVLLEPPHFRCDISGNLQEQIVSKFGRDGLLVNVRYTGKDNKDNREMYDSEDDGHSFQERFNAYMHELMGSRDIYVCPICYCYKYNALTGITISDQTVCDVITSRSFEYDPMSILIDTVSDDDDNFHFASTFCFRLLREVKHHITNIHNIDLSHIKGNDLFKGYQIRAPDGLLQRWLKVRFPRTIDAQDMRRYWADGYNRLDYLELAFRVDHDQSLRSTDHQFFESFQGQALTLWEIISGAFERLENDEQDDFIVDEGLESDTSGESGPRNVNLFIEESDPEVEFVKRLRARRAADSSSSSSHSEQHSSEESVGLGDNDESQIDSDDISDSSSEDSEEEEEEEDEWLSQKMMTPKKIKKSSPQTSAEVTLRGKFSKLRKLSAGSPPVQDSETDQDTEDTSGCFESDVEKKRVSAEQTQNSATKKKRAVFESDDSE